MSSQNITIRSAQIHDAPRIAEIQIEGWQTAYRGLVADEAHDNLNLNSKTVFWFQRLRSLANHEIVLVACDEQSVIGFLDAGPSRTQPNATDAEIDSIYVLSTARRMGFGQTLVNHACQLLQHQGNQTVSVRCLADSVFQAFYRKQGGRCVEELPIQIGNQRLNARLYRWGLTSR